MLENNSDEQLVSNYLKGDKKSLEILILRYLKPIYSFVYQYVRNTTDAEDLTQEIFVKIWKNLKRFKKEKKFKTWLFVIAKNACFDFLRKKEKDSVLNLESISQLIDSSSSPDEFLEKKFLKEKIKKIIKKLPEKTKEVLNLYYYQGFTFKEIAKIFNESINTIKSRHLRAIATLKKLLEEID
jgi:RNA polymerase sigma-70 factor (ECF subfamily)